MCLCLSVPVGVGVLVEITALGELAFLNAFSGKTGV